MHWKAWTSLIVNKKEGGMGFKDFNAMNSAHLAKQAWRAIKNPQALWVQVLKSIYHPTVDFLQAKRKRYDSWVWASLLHGRDIVKKNARWQVGKGDMINVTEDIWLASGERILNMTSPGAGTVSELLDYGNSGWNLSMLRNLFDPHTVRNILMTPIRWFEGSDRIWWPFVKSGEYSVKSGYWHIMNQEQIQDSGPSSSSGVLPGTWKTIWNAYVPQKIKIFLWKICHDILPVKANLHRRKVAQSNLCQICKLGAETSEHSLLLCPWTRPVWFGLSLGITPEFHHISSLHEWLEDRLVDFNNLPDQKDLAFTTVCCALWGIWLSRNKFLFEGTKPDPRSTLIQIRNMIDECSSMIPEKRRPHPSSTRNFVPWRPPLPGVIKLNVDASYSQLSGYACAGIVGRNHKGEIVTGLTKKMFASSPLTAESLALREAISLAANLQLDQICLESDCLDLIRACRGEFQQGEIMQLLQDIWFLKGSFRRCGFTWVARSGNMLAHTIAKLEHSGSLPNN